MIVLISLFSKDHDSCDHDTTYFLLQTLIYVLQNKIMIRVSGFWTRKFRINHKEGD